MAGKKKISDADRALFEKAMADVKRLRNDKVSLSPPRQRPKPRRMPPAPARTPFPTPPDPPTLAADEHTHFMRPGVQRRVMQDLRRGKIAPTAQLDLHGYTLAHAEPALDEFLKHSAAHGHRCVCIIHGKGAHRPQATPVLKNAVAYWLPYHAGVLAYCSAPANAGGSGAVYVLLRKHTS